MDRIDRRGGGRPATPIRVMIVDDSIVARTILARMIEEDGAFEVVAVASGADQALAILSDRVVDIILLDIQMPGIDGITALPRLLERSGGARILVVSSSCSAGAAATVRALTVGAADTLLKPAAGSLGRDFAERLIERLRRIGRSPAGAQRDAAPADWLPPAAQAAGEMRCLAIGASTGGPHALSTLLMQLPDAFPAPILITQHLPPSFIPYFADQLRELTGRPASVAVDGGVLRPGEIVLAPGDAHLRCRQRRDGSVQVILDRSPAPSGCLPSVDPMMSAVAALFGASAVAVMLTGMGRDGVFGASAIAAAGGEVYAQDAGSSVVWGMPGAVADAGIASALLPPDEIGRRIAARAETAAWN